MHLIIHDEDKTDNRITRRYMGEGFAHEWDGE